MGAIPISHRVVVALMAMCMAYASCGEASADPVTEGTKIECRTGSVLTTCRVVSSAKIRQANAAFEMNKRLTAKLIDCAATVAERSKPEAGWKIAAKAFGVGLLVSGAFALGVML